MAETFSSSFNYPFALGHGPWVLAVLNDHIFLGNDDNYKLHSSRKNGEGFQTLYTDSSGHNDQESSNVRAAILLNKF